MHPFELATTPAAAVGADAPLILYAEDNYLLSLIVKDVLELCGWRVRHCREGSAALAIFRLRDPFDLAIIDDELPFADGLTVIRDARQQPHRRDTPIILVSLDDRAEEAQRAGADAFLRKPQDMPALVATVRRLLAGRAAV